MGARRVVRPRPATILARLHHRDQPEFTQGHEHASKSAPMTRRPPPWRCALQTMTVEQAANDATLIQLRTRVERRTMHPRCPV